MSSSGVGEPGNVVADSTRVGIAVLCMFGVAWTVVLLPLSSASTPVAVAAMGGAIIATGRVGWIPLIAALVVGLHFVPLARAFGEMSFRWAGAVLAVLGGVGLVLATTNAATLAAAVTITSVGSSITLLAAATALLRRHGRLMPRKSASN